MCVCMYADIHREKNTYQIYDLDFFSGKRNWTVDKNKTIL